MILNSQTFQEIMFPDKDGSLSLNNLNYFEKLNFKKLYYIYFQISF
jgi:hypothetical protein